MSEDAARRRFLRDIGAAIDDIVEAQDPILRSGEIPTPESPEVFETMVRVKVLRLMDDAKQRLSASQYVQLQSDVQQLLRDRHRWNRERLDDLL